MCVRACVRVCVRACVCVCVCVCVCSFTVMLVLLLCRCDIAYVSIVLSITLQVAYVTVTFYVKRCLCKQCNNDYMCELHCHCGTAAPRLNFTARIYHFNNFPFCFCHIENNLKPEIQQNT